MPIKILVAEDTEKELQIAKNIAEEKLVNVEIDFIRTSAEAMQGIQSCKYQGILSDVFFDGKLCGIEIAKCALKQRLPVVLITNTWHHGKCQEVSTWSENVSSVPLIDSDFCEDKKSKNWLAGFLTILWVIKFSPKITNTKIACDNSFIRPCYRLTTGSREIGAQDTDFITIVKNYVKL